MSEVIILARMYVGKYLEENIGHEVINLFKSDNGNNYIYVPHNGKINPKYNNKVKAVVLVRYVEEGVMEVVAKAEKLEQVLFKTGNIDEEATSQVEYIDKNKVTYGDVPLYKIYHNNVAEKITITFKCDKLLLSANPLYLVEDQNKTNLYTPHILLPEKHFSKQSLRMYYTQTEVPQDYSILSKMLSNDELWETDNNTKKLDINEYSQINRKNNFLNIIKKEYDEIVFSNMLAYFFKQNQDVFIRFAKDVLKIDSFSKNYNIKREYKNVDLLIEDDNTVLVIENKIKSKVNGECNAENSLDNHPKSSQLEKYYDTAIKYFPNKKKIFFIFAPDYNYINKDNYATGKDYNIIYYSQIYNFYKANAGEMLNIDYFTDFLNALSIHTKTVDNSNYDIMKEKFIDKIKRIKEI